MISQEAAGEVAAVVRVFIALHINLVAGIELWHASNGKQKGDCELVGFECPSRKAGKAYLIVIVDKWCKPLGMRIERVLAQHHREFLHGGTSGKGVDDRVLQG